MNRYFTINAVSDLQRLPKKFSFLMSVYVSSGESPKMPSTMSVAVDLVRLTVQISYTVELKAMIRNLQSNSTPCPKHQTGERRLQLRRH